MQMSGENVSLKGKNMCKYPEWENVLGMLKEQIEEERIGDEVSLKYDY